MTNSPSKTGCVILAAFLLALTLAAGGVGFAAHELNPATVLERQQAIEEQRQKATRDDAFWRSVMPAQVAAYSLIIVGLPLALLIALVGGGALAWSMARHRRGLVWPKNGVLPVHVAHVVDGSTLPLAAAGIAGHHAAQVEAARNPVHQLPPGLRTYSPRYGAPRIVGSDPNAAPSLAAPPEPVRTPAPSFGELLERGLLGPGRFALGWNPNAGIPAYGIFADLYSVAILGATGSGKSTTARALVSQTALNDGKLIVIDPHLHATRDSLAGDLAPLSSAFLLPPVDDDPTAIKHALGAVLDLLEDRKAGATGPTVLVVCDEWTSLVSRGGPRAELLTRTMRLLAVEGRKLGLHGMVCMQDATKEAVGPLRDVLSSAYVHRSRPQHARMVAPGLKADTWSLAPGQAWLDQTSGPPRLLAMPECTAADVATVGRLLPSGPKSDSASWAQVPLRAAGESWKPGDPGHRGEPNMGQIPTTPTAPARPELRIIRPETGVGGVGGWPPTSENRDENAPAETEPPSPPPTLAEKARAACIPLDEEETRLVEAMDAGKTPAGAAAALAGQHKGGKYSRLKSKAEELQKLIEGWPNGEAWEG